MVTGAWAPVFQAPKSPGMHLSSDGIALSAVTKIICGMLAWEVGSTPERVSPIFTCHSQIEKIRCRSTVGSWAARLECYRSPSIRTIACRRRADECGRRSTTPHWRWRGRGLILNRTAAFLPPRDTPGPPSQSERRFFTGPRALPFLLLLLLLLRNRATVHYVWYVW